MKKQSNSIHTERLTVRTSKELLEQVRKQARENEMSVAAYVRMVLKRETRK